MNNKKTRKPVKEKIKQLKKAIGKILNPGKQLPLVLQPLRVKKIE
jgi:hypothetical protein